MQLTKKIRMGAHQKSNTQSEYQDRLKQALLHRKRNNTVYQTLAVKYDVKNSTIIH
jgi:hypothetical protein